MDSRLQMYKELTEACGVPGYEHLARAVMRRYLEPLGQVMTDNLGSIVAHKPGTGGGPKVLVVGHLDECGFMVTHISDKGFLRFQPLGGWWAQVLLAQRVMIRTHKGEVPGIIGSKPPHILTADERNKVVPIKEMYIDIGVCSREEAMEAGVRPGDPIVPICPFTVMPNPKVMMAKAWDNRAGCAAAIHVLEELQGQTHPCDLYVGATVQEEVGPRGAITIANKVQPDIAIILDVGVAGDTPGVREDEVLPRMGKGPTILLYDHLMIPNLRLRDLVVETAAMEGIPVQFDVIPGGGTDGGPIHTRYEGVPSIAIGFATRYIHSHAGLIHRDDIENAARLVAALVKRLDGPTVSEIKNA